MTADELRSLSVDALERLVRRHNELYFVKHTPEISDYEFDRLVRRLRDIRPDSPALDEFVEIPELGRRVVHEERMLSLDKCYEEEEIAHWADQVQGDFLVMPKIDGVACSILFGPDGTLERAATRGDGEAGEDVTQNARLIPDIPRKVPKGPFEIRGEVFMRLSDFARYNAELEEKLVNPRNGAAGALKLKELPERPYPLSFFAYDSRLVDYATEADRFEAMEQAGFAVVPWGIRTRDELQKAFELHLSQRQGRDYETDGVVYRANRVSERRRLGVTAHHPRWSIAYKFQGESATTRLVAVEWSISRTGAITPVGVVEPVMLSGATVTRCSLHNAGLVRKLDLKVGAEVVAMRRGGVIPHIESVASPGNEPVVPPDKCPSCGSATRLDGDFLWCTRPQTCRAALVGRLAHYLTALEIEGLGEKILLQLVDKGLVRDIPGLYGLTMPALVSLDRMGETLAAKLTANIEAKRKVPLEAFLCGLGIDDLGPSVAGTIVRLAGGDLDRVLAMTEQELGAAHGVGETIAANVVHGLEKQRPVIDALRRLLTIEGPAELDPSRAKLTGKSFVFTGTLKTMTRSAAQKLVRDLGGETPSGVTKQLSFLVIGDDEWEGKPTGKRAKGEKYNAEGSKIALITERQFLELTGD